MIFMTAKCLVALCKTRAQRNQNTPVSIVIDLGVWRTGQEGFPR